MDYKHQFLADVKNGKICLAEPEKLNTVLESLEGKTVLVSVERFHSRRTLNQNNYYWGVVIDMIAKEIGMFKDETHEAMKFKFLSIPSQGKKPATVRSTKRLKTSEFNEYVENIRVWASQFLSLYIPDPRE